MLRNGWIELASNFHKLQIGRYQKLAEALETTKELNDQVIAEYNSRKSIYQSLIDSCDDDPKVSIYEGLKEVTSYSSFGDHAAARSAHAAINNAVINVNYIAELQQEQLLHLQPVRDEMLNLYKIARFFRFNYLRELAKDCVSKAQIKTKTNADGECKINLHRGKDLMIVAYSDRSVGDSSEEYNWFIPYTTPVVKAEDSLLISNDTLSDSTSPDTADLEAFKYPSDVVALQKIEPYKLTLN